VLTPGNRPGVTLARKKGVWGKESSLRCTNMLIDYQAPIRKSMLLAVL